MEKKKVENLIIRYNNVLDNLSMNFKLLEFLLEKITLTEKEVDEMIEHFKNKEEYELCNKIIKKR